MSQEGLYIQIAGHGLAVGWDRNEGFAFSYFTEAALGISGSAWATVYMDPRDLDFFDNDPTDGFWNAGGALYLGGGTPIGTPGINFQVQKNMLTGDMFITLGGGTESIFEIGAYSEGQNGWSVQTITSKDLRFQSEGVIIVTQTTHSENGYSLVNTYAVDEDGNLLTPIESRSYLEQAGYDPNPINSTVYEIYKRDGSTVTRHESCFAAGTPIDMWPRDQKLKADANGIFDQATVRAQIWQKPIEEIQTGDLVAAFDTNGNLVPGYVPRTMVNQAKILLNFHGTKVTPGHVYYRADSARAQKFETLIDVLRDDGVIENRDGTPVRAATNVPVGHPHDRFVQAVAGTRQPDGSVAVKARGHIRLGTRFIIEGARSYAVADLIDAGGGHVGEDGLIHTDNSEPMPFHWEFGDALPRPEDYVLACSGTTVEDIYREGEWEGETPHMPHPLVMDGGPVQPLSPTAHAMMPRNEPIEPVPYTVSPKSARKPFAG